MSSSVIQVDILEQALLASPDVTREAPVEHIFAPGVYVRQITIPAQSLIVGHRHKTEHLCLLLQGTLVLINEDGTTTELHAPKFLVAGPGRKAAFAVNEVVWLNFHATDKTDVDSVEEEIVEKSEAYLLFERACAEAETEARESDRKAFEELSPTQAGVLGPAYVADNTTPAVQYLRVSTSPISGNGLHATSAFAPGEPVAPFHAGSGLATAINHSNTPNSELSIQFGVPWFVASKRISGMRGGLLGDEVTADYAQVAAFLELEETKCLAQP